MLCSTSFSLSWLVTGLFVVDFGGCLNSNFALGACIFSLLFSVLLYKTVHSAGNDCAGVFPAVGRSKSLLQDRYSLFPLASEGSGNSCLESGLEPPWARIYSMYWVLKAHQEGLAATWGSLRDWEGNFDGIILKNYSPSPARLAWCCPLFLSCKSHYWNHGRVPLLWICRREHHFRDILILSPSAPRIILGVSSALKWNRAGVEMLKSHTVEHFELICWDFSCAFIPREGENSSVPLILPLKKDWKIQFP